ncbi:MAG: imidazole glycerol phosphate synthase subunit HisH [Rhodocyclaceae bacterium]|nr:MAG: imidazole glycerol phosphate synthase subunit HisH [Rhodocyclaceae bacterium]
MTPEPTVHIIDYGLGNIGSIANMIRKMGGQPVVCRDPANLIAAERIILPGVGAFDAGMSALENAGFVPPLLDAVTRQVPLLGICLGMQLLFPASEEGERPGLDLIRGRIRRFDPAVGLKVPHMGWNRVEPATSCSLFAGLEDNRFYFVHSYYADCERAQDVAGTTVYGQPFASAVQVGKVFGAQFHPEKSHKFGMRLVANFLGVH